VVDDVSGGGDDVIVVGNFPSNLHALHTPLPSTA
jgi:hypothetical protein